MASFSLGRSKTEQVVVTVYGYERAVTGEYFDDNWVSVEVSVSVGAFSGRYQAAFLTEDFVRFQSSLQPLVETLTGQAEFTTLEEQLTLKVAAVSRGNIEVNGIALDQAGIGNKFQFHLEFDQTHLAETLRDLNEIKASFPIRSASQVTHAK